MTMFEEALFGLYEKIGYPVVYASTVTGEGIDQLREILSDRMRDKVRVMKEMGRWVSGAPRR